MKKITGFAEGSDIGNFHSARDWNSKAFDLNIWKDKFPLYETEETVAGAGFLWDLEFDFGCLLI